MCGIAGIISTDPENIRKERLVAMSDSLAHRGPDGEDFWIDADRTIGFAHRRLAIIDLSPQASQPMHYLDRYTIIFNGEIYNFKELKEDLKKENYFFRTASDTEVILAAYDRYKADCVQYLDGMFSFAIWDKTEKTLFAARDRFGEKPFYYAFDERSFSFASERKALWSIGIPKEVNQPLLLNYLALGYTTIALDKTITWFQHVYSLPPAHSLLFNFHSFSFNLQSYWDCSKETVLKISEQRAQEQFHQLFSDSINKRLRSDVAIGFSLSGGLDSSAIVGMVNRANGIESHMQSFSAVYPGFDKDESVYVNMVAGQFGLQKHFVTPTAQELANDFNRLCYHQEEPFSSSSIYAQFRVFEEAKKAGIKVVMDGQGSDEVLGGYDKYFHWFLQELFKKNPLKAFSQKKALQKNNASVHFGMRNLLAALFPAQASIQLEKREAKKILGHPDISNDFRDANFDRQSLYKPLVIRLNDILYYNTFQQGLEDLLRYADRNSMAHGCEVRLPFLSHQLVSFIFSLPSSFKIHDGWTKWILRKEMENILPEKITWRKDKIGYETPQLNWMKNKIIQEMIYASKEKLAGRGVLNQSALNKKIQPHDAHAADSYDWRYLVAATCIE